jgi:hypothetical protein
MPTSVGPNTFGEENLVFGYDLGDVSNSYKGEPITNIWGVQTGFNVNQRSGWDMPYAYNGAITNSVYTGGTWNGNRIWEVLHTAGTSGYAGYESWRLCVDQPLAGTGTYSTTRRVAIKICVLEGSITDMALHSGGGNGGYNGGDWIPIPESQVPRDCPVKTGWYQFLADGSWNSDSVGHCVGLGFINYNRVKILTTEPMYYPANHLVPFTGASRSATQGLLDLTGNSTIDLTNVSFDSNAQMTFDGTDDYVSLGDNSVWDFGQNGTIEVMVYPTNSTGNDRLWCIDNNASNLDAYLNSSGYNVYMHGGVVGTTTPLTQNKWNHLVVTYNAGTVQIYINGAAGTMTGTTTGYNITNNSSNNSNLYLGCYRDLGYNLYGDLDLFKIYNRALTAAEVQRNFNAIKGRFSIL